MQTITINDFKTDLVKYLEIANAGQNIAIIANEKQLAMIIPPVSQINHKAQAKKKLRALAENTRVGDVISSTGCIWEV